MEYTRVFHRKFEHDVSSIMDWYDSHQYGLGARFLANSRDTVQLISQDPTRIAVSKQELRYLSVKISLTLLSTKSLAQRFTFWEFFIQRVILIESLRIRNEHNKH